MRARARAVRWVAARVRCCSGCCRQQRGRGGCSSSSRVATDGGNAWHWGGALQRRHRRIRSAAARRRQRVAGQRARSVPRPPSQRCAGPLPCCRAGLCHCVQAANPIFRSYSGTAEEVGAGGAGGDWRRGRAAHTGSRRQPHVGAPCLCPNFNTVLVSRPEVTKPTSVRTVYGMACGYSTSIIMKRLHNTRGFGYLALLPTLI